MSKKKILLSVMFLIFIFSLSILFFALPKSERSENEKRVLAVKPDLSFSSVSNGTFSKELDTYIADHFPFRDIFVGINSYAKLLLGENGDSGVYKCDNGYLISEQAEFDLKKAEANLKNMLAFSQKTGLSTTYVIVPSSGYIMNDVLPKFHKEFRDGEIFSLTEKVLPKDEIIDLREIFNKNSDGVQLYYKTDHHLTSAGSMLMYSEVCKAKGLSESKFTLTKTVGDFYGTAYSKSGLWLTKGDNVEIWQSGKSGYQVTIKEGKETTVSDSLYFEDHLNDMDKYPVFLDGNHALVTVKNDNCKNGKRLLMIKDSFAHCFSTFLIENYEEICMVDMRYFRESLTKLIESEKLNELMFVYGVENTATSTDIAWLSLL